MSKHNKHNEYNKTERYLREETSAQKNVGQNQASNKIGQTDLSKHHESHKKENWHEKKHAEKSAYSQEVRIITATCFNFKKKLERTIIINNYHSLYGEFFTKESINMCKCNKKNTYNKTERYLL